ncbi:PAS domain S-box protein [Burkholderia plantarii]|uniref:PAS domain S-box protein n=1 Tax=Burkholderia plantarii TaxID=41899 RepID=UPI001F5B699F|nr:PAS domain S-box protein [Burkholderia plantarii]
MRRDGSRFWAHVVIDAIRQEGELIGFAKVTRDITERRKAPNCWSRRAPRCSRRRRWRRSAS